MCVCVRACWDEGGERERERDVTEQNIYINITYIQADRDEDKYKCEICRDREREARGFMPTVWSLLCKYHGIVLRHAPRP